MTRRLERAATATAGRFPLRPGKPLVHQRANGLWGYTCICTGHNRPDAVLKPTSSERHNCDSWEVAYREAWMHVLLSHMSARQYEIDALETAYALADAPERTRP